MAAATITLTDGGSFISIQYSAAHIVTIPKLGLKTKLKNGKLLLYWDSAWENKAGRPWVELDPDDISSPTVANVAALRTLILGWISTETPEEGGGSATYVGLPSNGDFTTAYLAVTQITLSDLPSGIVNIADENIEIVRQINTGGEVVATYERGDAAMSITANVLTITGATFAASDTFVVYTNIAHSINTTKVLGLDTYTEGTTKGNIVGAVRKDTPGTLADTDNEFAPVQLNALGNQRTDLASVVDTAIDVNSGNLSAGTQRFTLATDDVNTSAIKASVELLEAGLAAPTAFRSTAVDETGGVAVKAATGDVYGWNFYNPNTYDVFVKFYNTAQGSVVVGTTAVVETLQVPSLGSVVIKQDAPIKSFSIAITIAATKLVADNDDTAIISDVFAHVYYK